MQKTVLISGGSGLVGSRLITLLQEKNYEVGILSRNPNNSSVETIQWDVEKGVLDPRTIEKYDHIIHLAGAGIVDEPWTDKRKKVIIDSRVKSTQLLKSAILSNKKKPKTFVSASAVGYYGFTTTDHIYKEEDAPGNDFLAETCIQWEKSIDEINKLGIPTAKIRIGLVLSKEGGALKEIAGPVKLGIGAPLGSGKQYMPWIHIDDLCRIFIHATEKELVGAYNGGAPNQHTNAAFTELVAKVLNKPLWLPNVPNFVLKLILGSRALLVLNGSRVSPEKIMEKGFHFKFNQLEEALKDIYT